MHSMKCYIRFACEIVSYWSCTYGTALMKVMVGIRAAICTQTVKS